ncbi:M81 family metallopeptidase [Fimbriiglobus ruber]|uniref:MlrC n=1 Tax=Fimbriiglobus ruber TaxID=1908690 RepID=A0A225DRH2_9BACT|nr:M81 family metallopeptidase [Fimbriiglobus ruber]OWK43901.1 MlrC [Fimbriiglobus ruber]
MRVGIISLMHESNTFATGRTPLSAFECDRLMTGPAIRDALAGTHHEIGGFFDQLGEDRIEAVPLFAAWTMPSGTIEATASDALVEQLIGAVRSAGPLDAYLLAPHGAAVAENALDFDGLWMSRVKELVGLSIPVIGTLDLHCNLSPRMADAASALVSYRRNPHTDQRDRGREAAALLARTLRGDVIPTAAATFPPLVVNIEAQATAESPCRELYAVADDIRRRPGVLSVSLNLGFPYADVPEMGASAIVVTDNDPALARQYADELGGWWWDHREDFRGRLISPAVAVTRAATAPAPVCLLDMGDNVGGGSPADATILPRELLTQRVGPSFACLNDPEAVAVCNRAGVGATLTLAVGGKTDDRHGEPIVAPFTVHGLFDGHFEEIEARHGGLRHYDQGPTAVVSTDTGLTLMLTSRRTAPFSLRQLTAFGLDPQLYRVLVAKGVHAPVAAYAPVCRTLIRVNTPGVTSADLSQFSFRHRRTPLFPFE